MKPLPGAPRIVSVGTGLPPHHITQAEVTEFLRQRWAAHPHHTGKLEGLHSSVQVQDRYLSLPAAGFMDLTSFAQRNRVWLDTALTLGEKVCRDALSQAGLLPSDVDHLFFVSVTGIATPSIDARLVNRLGLRTDVKRTPIFGLGCVAGAAGVARCSDYLRAFPEQTCMLLSVELCSLTLQPDDLSVANLIATGLFGDGSAAVVLRGAATDSGGIGVPATRSVFYRDTERVMGWDMVDSGFKIVLSAMVPAMVRDNIRRDVDEFLQQFGLGRRDIRHWVVHTGGPKVLEAFAEALELPAEALARSWNSLRQVGNLSSASVLFVLREFVQMTDVKPGEYGVLLAMGPGFCSELVLLKW